MSNTVIELKYSVINAAPVLLNIAEPAYSYVSNTFFIGSPAGTGAIPIGGKFYLDQQQTIYNLANAAFNQANTGTSSLDQYSRNTANAAFEAANLASIYANGAFVAANSSGGSVGIYANGAFLAANSSGVYSNGAFAAANVSGTYANGAFAAANVSGTYANGAFASANNRALKVGDTFTGNITIANGNVTIINTSTSVSNTTGALVVTGGVGIRGNVYADAVYDGGIEVIVFANNAYNTANGAFSKANNEGGVNNTQNTNITSASTYANAAFAAANAATATDATQNTNIISASTYANGAFAAANTADTKGTSAGIYANGAFAAANVTSVYANGAFTRANNSLSANAGGTVTGNVTVLGDLAISGNLTITGNAFSINVGSLVANDSLIVLAGTNYTSDTLDIGIIAHYNNGSNAHTGLLRDAATKEWYLFKEYTPEIGANNNVNINSPSFIPDALNANVHSNFIKIKEIEVLPYINASFESANSAGIYANGAFSKANNEAGVNNTQNTNITSASTYANGAFTKANNEGLINNTQNTNITSASTYANGAFAAANVSGTYANGAFAAANNRALKVGDTFTGNVTIANGNVTIINTSTSVSNTTGALVVTGGVGVRGNVYADNVYDGGIEVLGFANNSYNTANAAFIAANNALPNTGSLITVNGNSVLYVSNTTKSNSYNTGALIVNGGIGANGNVYIKAENACWAVVSNANIYQVSLSLNDSLGSLAVGWGTNTSPGQFMSMTASGSRNQILSQTRDFRIVHGSSTDSVYVYAAQSSVQLASIETSTSNVTGALKIGGGLGVKGNVYADGVYDNNIRVITFANLAYNHANAAFIAANNAAGGIDQWTRNQANGAYETANSAGIYANGAFSAANVSGTYANGAFAAANNRALKVGDTFTGNLTIANGNVIIINSTTSVSNTTGALVVDGGVGIRGNVFLANANNFVSPGDTRSFRLGWVDNYFAKNLVFNGMDFVGLALTLNAPLYAGSAIYARQAISKDTGNNVVVFAATSPVRIQNSNTSISNTTGALIVGGGIGVSGNVYADNVFSSNVNIITFANLAYNHANAAFIAANNAAGGIDQWNRNQANGAYDTANSASIYANGAFVSANNRALKVGDTFTGNVTVANGNVIVINTTTSVSNTTGALVVTGGLGVRGNIYTDNVYIGFINVISYIQDAYETANDAYALAFNTSSYGIYANGAFSAANVASIYANGAFDKANNEAGVNVTQNTNISVADDKGRLAGIYANGAFAAANISGTYANNAFIKANGAFAATNSAGIYANGAFTTANSAGIYANGAFIAANTADNKGSLGGIYANGAFSAANSAGNYANAAFIAANNAAGGIDQWNRNQANGAYETANSAGIYANGAFTTANSAGIYANGAFIAANTKLNASGGTITGSLNVSSNIYVGDYIDFDVTKVNPTRKEGRLFYDKSQHALSYYNETDMTLQIGQEHVFRVWNNSGTTILNGKAVYITPGSSANGFPNVALANAATQVTSEVVGIATQDIPSTGYGFVTSVGKVNDLNTSGFTEGLELFLSATSPGDYTNTPPAPPSVPINIGYTTFSDPTTGAIYVSIHLMEGVNKTTGAILFARNNLIDEDPTHLFWDYANNRLGINAGTTPQANLHVAGDGLFTGNVVISGNLSISNAQSIVTQTLDVGGNLIVLNSNTSGAPVANAEIRVNRGSETNSYIRWDETINEWTASEGGAAGHIITSEKTAQTWENYTAFAVYQKASYPIGANLANATNELAKTADSKATIAENQAISAFHQANAAFITANTADNRSTSAGIYANGAFIAANTADNKGSLGGIYANGAFSAANSAGTYANGAFATANTAHDKGLLGGIYANGAFSAANSAGTYANGAFAAANVASVYANGAFTRANNSLNANTGGIVTGLLNVTSNIVTTNLTLTSNATTNIGALKLVGFPSDTNLNTGLIQIGVPLGFVDTNIIISAVENVNSYAQYILQNQSNGTRASSDYIVNNDRPGGTAIYGDFGINSSTYDGASPFNLPDGTYLYGAGGSLTVGTNGAHDFRIATNDTLRANVQASTGKLHHLGDAEIGGTFSVKGPSPGKMRTVSFIIDGGGSVITAGQKGNVFFDFAGTIDGWTVLGDASGSITVDVSKSTYATFPTFTASGGTSPALSTAQKNQRIGVDWTGFTTVSANDIIRFVVSGTPTTVTLVTVALEITSTS